MESLKVESLENHFFSEKMSDDANREFEKTLENIKEEPVSSDEKETNDVIQIIEGTKKCVATKRKAIKEAKTGKRNKKIKKTKPINENVKCKKVKGEDKENNNEPIVSNQFDINCKLSFESDNEKAKDDGSSEPKRSKRNKKSDSKGNRQILDEKLQGINKKEGRKQLTIKFKWD